MNYSQRKKEAKKESSNSNNILNPLWSIAHDKEDPEVAAIVAQTIGIDTHNHMDVPFKAEDFNAHNYDLIGELKNPGFLQCV